MIKQAAALAAVMIAGAAHAQPAPTASAAGAVIHGPVLQVTDSRHLWVATGAARADWVELLIKGADEGPVPVPDRLGPALLMSVAFGKTADCTLLPDARHRKVADCRIEGQPLMDLLRRPGAVEAARAWAPARKAVDAPLQLASR